MSPLPPLPVSGNHPELEQLAAAWVYTHAAENTRRAYWADLAAFAAFCGEREASPLTAGPSDVEEFRDEAQARGASPATVARRLSALASFYRYAAEQEIGAGDQVVAVGRPVSASARQADVLSEQEVVALLKAADGLGAKTACLVRLLVLDGLKLGEVIRADVADVVGRGRAVALRLHRDSGTTEVQLDPRTATALARYLEGRAEGPLLLSDRPAGRPSGRLTRFGANYLVKRAAEAAQLARSVSANTLRRHFVTASLESGSHIKALQRRIGHADSRTTRRLSNSD